MLEVTDNPSPSARKVKNGSKIRATVLWGHAADGHWQLSQTTGVISSCRYGNRQQGTDTVLAPAEEKTCGALCPRLLVPARAVPAIAARAQISAAIQLSL
jgi:hypothetical protein